MGSIGAWLGAQWFWLKLVLLAVAISAVFFAGVHYESLRWDAHDGKMYAQQVKDLQAEVDRQNKINAETRSKLDKVKKLTATTSAELKRLHEQNPNTCVASADSVLLLRAAIRETQNR